jgi:nucleotide-binding universal stress UspA family protein
MSVQPRVLGSDVEIRLAPSAPAPTKSAVRHALVALDRSASREACLGQARVVERAFGARLTLAHVMPSHRDAGIAGPGALEWEIARRDVERDLLEARGSLLAGGARDVGVALTQGVPADRIVAVARDVGADLVIIATHRGGEPAALGDTAERVLSLARSSVLLAHPAAEAGPPTRIAVPLDGSARTESVLPAAAVLARAFGAEVALLHVVGEIEPSAVLCDPEDLAMSRRLSERMAESAARYLGRVRERVLHDLETVHTVVRRSHDERRAILEAAQHVGADLVVLSAHGRTCDVDRPCGSVAATLVARARTPVLVLWDLEPTHLAGAASPQERLLGNARRNDGN